MSKIVQATVHDVRVPVDGGASANTKRGDWAVKDVTTANHVLLRVETNDGLVGWGDGFALMGGGSVRAALSELIIPSVIGQDARDIAGLNLKLQKMHHLWGRYGATMFAISALDTALWDLAGKREGKPLCALLGGAPRALPAYASLVRYGTPEKASEVALCAVAEGFKTIKLHEVDNAVIRAVRNAIGPDIDLINDANSPFTPEQAIETLTDLRDLNLLWYEEPCWPPEDYEGLARVRAESGVPTAAGEVIPSAHEFRRLFDAKAVSFAQTSVAKIGGVTEALNVIELARAYDVPLMFHAPYYGPSYLATQHIISARAPESLLEWLYFPDLAQDMYGNQSRPNNGHVQTPSGPGLGFDPDPAWII